jgi:pimeloyl-ACP methyl ester carboxylesterase
METMNTTSPRTSVLVHGAFVGAWSWSRVVPELEAAGHAVYAPALTGVGERAKEATPDVGLLVHIDQITRLVEANDLRDVVLVGHSYGGMVVAGVARRVPRRIAGIVYVDAFVPEPGQSAFDVLPSLRDAFAGLLLPERPWLVAPFPLAALGVDDPQLREWAEPQLTPMLWKAVEETLPTDATGDLGDLPTVFVHCARGKFFDDSAVELRSRGIPVMTLDEGHMPHLTNPVRLAATLIKADHEIIHRTRSLKDSSPHRA